MCLICAVHSILHYVVICDVQPESLQGKTFVLYTLTG